MKKKEVEKKAQKKENEIKVHTKAGAQIHKRGKRERGKREREKK